MVRDGSSEIDVGMAAPSATKRWLMRCASPVGPAKDCAGSAPSGAVPVKWLPAQNCAFGCTDRRPIFSTGALLVRFR